MRIGRPINRSLWHNQPSASTANRHFLQRAGEHVKLVGRDSVEPHIDRVTARRSLALPSKTGSFPLFLVWGVIPNSSRCLHHAPRQKRRFRAALHDLSAHRWPAPRAKRLGARARRRRFRPEPSVAADFDSTRHRGRVPLPGAALLAMARSAWMTARLVLAFQRVRYSETFK
jgi:hypothetical protein